MDKIIGRIKTFCRDFTSGIRDVSQKAALRSKELSAGTIQSRVIRPDNPYVRADSRIVQKRIKKEGRRAVLRERYDRMSLKTAFALYVTAFLLFALVLILLSTAFFGALQQNIINNYLDYANPDYNFEFFGSGGNELYFSDPYTGEYQVIQLSGVDIAASGFLDLLILLSVPALLIVSIIAAGLLFFRNRLEPPIRILADASQKIAEKNLGFIAGRVRGDELGRLCDSFEEMREVLLKNNNEMWRQMDERRRLNNAFSHDLRTPLTVLKGNAHMLLEYMPQGTVPDEKMEGTIRTMQNHISRMETYVEAMNSLQRLEDIDVNRREIASGELTGTLKNIAAILTGAKTLRFFDDIESETLFVDAEIVLQVAENLLVNAARFAKSRVAVVCSSAKNRLSISVSDDGPGFSKADLRLATNPFYKAKKNVYDTHFGLGLNISKILTERHGGGVILSNVRAGGATVRAEFFER